MLCPVCNNLTPETLRHVKPGQLATIFIDEYELSRAARSGECAECKLLVDAISLKRKLWSRTRQESQSIVLNVAIGKPLQIIWNKAGIFLQIFLPHEHAEPTDGSPIPDTIGTARLVAKFSGSEESLSTLYSWFSECKSSHTLCRPAQSCRLPTRVIDVGHDAESAADVSLLEAASMCGEYMALSYCWGDPKFHQVLKTLHSNVELYKERIPFQSLPLTL